jgi:hypothetical protein
MRTVLCGARAVLCGAGVVVLLLATVDVSEACGRRRCQPGCYTAPVCSPAGPYRAANTQAPPTNVPPRSTRPGASRRAPPRNINNGGNNNNFEGGYGDEPSNKDKLKLLWNNYKRRFKG